MARRNQRYRTLPHEFSQLGQVSPDVLKNTASNMFASIVTGENTLCLPITDAQFDAFLSWLRRGPFAPPSVADEGCPGINTNLAALQVQVPTIICGMCIVAVGEHLNFCQSGVLVDCPDAVGPAPAVMGACDGNAVPQEGQLGTIMQYGGPTWQFIEAFFRAFSIQVLMNDECLIVDLPVNEIGMCEIAPSFNGAGDSCVSTMPFIRETNQHATSNGYEQQFLPVNTIVTTGCDGVCTSICAPPPSAGATWGHTTFSGRHPKMFRFAQPIILVPAVAAINVQFDDWGNNEAFLCQMRAAVVGGSKCLGAVEGGPIGPSACFDNTAVVAGGCGPGVGHWPGGKVTIGIRLFGFRVSYSFCLDLFQQMVWQKSTLLGTYANTGWLQGLLGKMKRDDPRYATIAGLASGNLAGLPGADA